MALCDSIHSLKCRLCRNGLLRDYEVYSRETDEFGVPGEPELFECTTGYFYTKNTRHYSGILEIAGEIQERKGHDFHMLVFDDNARCDNLILIDGTFYRVDSEREIYSSCRLLDLEAERIESQY